MQRLLRLFCLACVVEVGLAYCSASAAAEVEAVGSQTPWRAFLVKGGNLVREDGVLRYRRGRDFADIGLVPGSRTFNVVWTRGRETVRDEVDLDSPNPGAAQRFAPGAAPRRSAHPFQVRRAAAQRPVVLGAGAAQPSRRCSRYH